MRSRKRAASGRSTRSCRARRHRSRQRRGGQSAPRAAPAPSRFRRSSCSKAGAAMRRRAGRPPPFARASHAGEMAFRLEKCARLGTSESTPRAGRAKGRGLKRRRKQARALRFGEDGCANEAAGAALIRAHAMGGVSLGMLDYEYPSCAARRMSSAVTSCWRSTKALPRRPLAGRASKSGFTSGRLAPAASPTTRHLLAADRDESGHRSSKRGVAPAGLNQQGEIGLYPPEMSKASQARMWLCRQ